VSFSEALASALPGQAGLLPVGHSWGAPPWAVQVQVRAEGASVVPSAWEAHSSDESTDAMQAAALSAQAIGPVWVNSS
jgi:hypothetical protein